jgi:hypothetical protein
MNVHQACVEADAAAGVDRGDDREELRHRSVELRAIFPGTHVPSGSFDAPSARRAVSR